MTDDVFSLAQFEALRTEILYLMKANESRIFASAGFATVFWSALVSMSAAGVPVPGVTFLAPGLVIVLALSVHMSYSKRVVNIGAFLAQLVDWAEPGTPNWEREVARFAAAHPLRVSSRVSVVKIYSVLTVVGWIAAVLMPLERVLENTTVSVWVVSDLVGSVALGLLIIVTLVGIASGGDRYSSTRAECDNYWRRRAAEWSTKKPRQEEPQPG